jgi:hypothetical protein
VATAKKSEPFEKQSNGIKGGKRPGAGRKAGVPNKKTAALQEAVAASGVTPLDFMLNIMRSEPPPEASAEVRLSVQAMQFEAAKAAAPYVHAKLSSIEMEASVTTKTLAQELAELNAQPDATGD